MKWLKNISENLVAKAASPLAEEGLIDKDVVKSAVIYNNPEARKQLENAHKIATAGSAIGATLVSPIPKVAIRILTHPITEAVGTATGFYNLATDQGVKKTIDHIKNEEYGRAALSALGDALDASPITGAVKGLKTGYKALRAGESIKNVAKTTIDNLPITKFKRMLSKDNRAKHAFVTINPFGYENPFRRGIKWTNSVLSDAPVDPNTFKASVEEFMPYLDPAHADFLNKNREDAWRIYNGLEQKFGTYIKNADGTYSYNLEEVMKRHPDLKINFQQDANNRHGYDAIGGNHGGLTGRITIDMGNGKQVHYIEDIWDLHPFSRLEDKISAKVGKYAVVPVGEALTMADSAISGLHDVGIVGSSISTPVSKWTDRMLDITKQKAKKGFMPKLDNWFANLEAGKIIGGTPFVMKTRIPTKTVWESVNGVPVPEMVYDDAVDYIIPKEPLQLKLNFENFTNSLENIK